MALSSSIQNFPNSSSRVCWEYLQLGFPALGTLAEDGYDESNAVNDRCVPGSLQVPLLSPREHCVHKDPAVIASSLSGILPNLPLYQVRKTLDLLLMKAL